MTEFLRLLFDTQGFPPRWNCGTAWTSGHGWLHVISDVAIFGAYAAIPVVLVYFMLRRNDLPFSRVIYLFAAFILFCGVGHLLEAVIFWHPLYRLAGVIKLGTAIVSWLTVFALIPIVPRLLRFPGLAAINERLHQEIQHRREIENKMQEEITRKEQLNRQLREFSRLAVDRERRMIELKEEINELAELHGEGARYEVGNETEVSP